MSVVLTSSSSLQDQLALHASNDAQTTRSLTEFGTVLFAILLLTLLLAGITYGIHWWRVGRPGRRRNRRAFATPQSRETGTSSNPARRRRRRRSNPSLAETGGLPPRRPSQPDPSQPSS